MKNKIKLKIHVITNHNLINFIIICRKCRKWYLFFLLSENLHIIFVDVWYFDLCIAHYIAAIITFSESNIILPCIESYESNVINATMTCAIIHLKWIEPLFPKFYTGIFFFDFLCRYIRYVNCTRIVITVWWYIVINLLLPPSNIYTEER